MPHHGITYRGKHSDEFGVIVKTVGRPPVAPVKQVDEEVTYRDGNLDLSETGGRLYYQDKVLQLEFTFIRPDTLELHMSVARFVEWLSGGYAELVFDDMPSVAWIAKPAELDDITIERFKNSKTVVQFRCRPFNKFLYDSRGIPLGAKIRLGAAIPIGMGTENYITFSNGTTHQNLNYLGSAPVRPVVKISLNSGTQSNMTLEVGGVSVTIGSIPSNQREFVIDCESGTMPEGVEGDFFEIIPGDNEITVVNNGSGGTVFFDYRHNFLYGGL